MSVWTLCLIVLEMPGYLGSPLSPVVVSLINGCVSPSGEGLVESLPYILVLGSQGPRSPSVSWT